MRPAAMVAMAGLAGGALALPARVAAQGWTHFGASAARVSVAPAAPGPMASPRWVATLDAAGRPVAFQGEAGVVTDGARVYAIGQSGGAWRVHAFDAATGAPWWGAPMPTPAVGSWSTPVVDAGTSAVYVASGASVSAFDAATGAPRWTLPLPRPVVNASPLVTADRGAADRLLVTDYNGFGVGDPARLWCVNVDPFDAASNPYQPGQVVWSVPLGAASGNSPAYAGGVVYVATAGDGTAGDPPRVIARGIDDPPTAADRWAYTLGDVEQGFFGGVSVGADAVYAATYAFFGGVFNATLVKLDAATGAERWTAPAGRTSSTPVPIAGGFVALSTGVDGFGSVPSVAVYRDLGSSAVRVLDVATGSWVDANGNGSIDAGEYTRVGGWTTLPAAAPLGRAAGTGGGPAARLYVGVPGTGASTEARRGELVALDLSRSPMDPAFVMERAAGAGATPAVAAAAGGGAWMFSVGTAGLVAFGPACYANCDGSTSVPSLNAIDFSCFLGRYRAGEAYANCDGSTTVPALNALDFSCFLNRYREGCP